MIFLKLDFADSFVLSYYEHVLEHIVPLLDLCIRNNCE